MSTMSQPLLISTRYSVEDLFADLWETDYCSVTSRERREKVHQLAHAIDANVRQHKPDGRPHCFDPLRED